MLYEQIQLSCSLVTSIDTETSLSASNLDRKGSVRRFNRSGSRQRSKSKQTVHELQDAQGFYIKKVFVPSSTPQERNNEGADSTSVCEKSGNCDKFSNRSTQRRNNHMRQNEANTTIAANGSREYYQKKCSELDQLLSQSHSYIIELQSRIDQLQEQIRRKAQGNESQSLRDRQELAKTAKQNKPNNLAHVRKQIASTKAVQLASPEALQNQIKLLQSQNLFLKEEVNTLKRTIKQHQQTFLRIRSQKQTQLQAIIQQQRKSLLQNQKLQEQLKTEVSMLRLRESKKDQNKQQMKNEQFAYLKFRCEKMRKKYDETKKALERYEKQERVNYLLSEGKSETQINFCLSP